MSVLGIKQEGAGLQTNPPLLVTTVDIGYIRTKAVVINEL